jgi:signal transduction histidine kinase/PAS domain-containing protein
MNGPIDPETVHQVDGERPLVPNDGGVTAAHAIVVPDARLGGIARYGIAVAATTVALGLTLLLEPYLKGAVFVLFFPAVLGTAVVAGLGPALLASLLSAFSASYWFIPPQRTFKIGTPTDLIALAIFLVSSIIVSTLADRRRLAEQRAAEAARTNADLAAKIEQQAMELATQLEESQSMAEELEVTTVELEERTNEADAANKFSREIVESITDPFVVHDAEWRFKYINSAAARIIVGARHIEPDALIGQVLWDVYPDLIGTKFEREMRRAASDRTPVQFEAFYAERGVWSQLYCYPLRGGGLATQWKNITARKKAEEALRYLDRASELLAAPLDAEVRLADLAHLVVPDFGDWSAIQIVGDDGALRQVAVAHVDPAKVKWAEELNRRFPPRSDAATGVPNVVRTGKPELYAAITEEMLVAGALDDEHLRIMRELGIASAMIVPLTARGHVFGAFTIVSTESRRRYTTDDLALASELARRAAIAIDNARQHQPAHKAQHEAENATEAKSQFLAAMCHELRTPLNAIAGYSQLLGMGVRGPVTEEQLADLARIDQSQRHLLGIINDVLDFARIEAGRVEYHLARVRVADLLGDLRGFMTPQLGARELEFHCDEPEDGVAVLADADKARQILLNLLSNSVKFTPPKGRIEVRCQQQDGRVFIHVSDTGIGIAPERVDSVFEPFVQVHRSLTEPTGGVGLGLAISRDLARAMGGDLRATSQVGRGSTFTLDLPSA